MSEQPPAPPVGSAAAPDAGVGADWAAIQPAPPLTRRRKVLIGLVVALVVAIVASIFALDAVVGSLAERPLGSASGAQTGDQLPDCADSYPAGFSDRARAELESWYGDGIGSRLAPTATPAGFPASSFAYSGIVPACGSAILGADGQPSVYLFYVENVSRTRFDAVTAMLTATGNVMTDDVVPREPQELDPDQLSGADAAGLDELYREVVVPGAGRIWLTLKTDDVLSTSGTGELIIEFSPGD